jgi:hypothetical protein
VKAEISNGVWGANDGWKQTIYVFSHCDWEVKSNLKAQQYIGSYPRASVKIGKPVSEVANAAQPLVTYFDVTTDRSGQFDHAYDIWADGEQYEIMIWNDWGGGLNPIAESYSGGNPVPWRQANINGTNYNVYTGKGGSGPYCISFLPTGGIPVNKVTLNISEFLKWITSQGYWKTPNPTLTSVQLGWEVCDTYGREMTFTVNDFEVWQGTRPPLPPGFPPDRDPVYPMHLNVGGEDSGVFWQDGYSFGGSTSFTVATIDMSALPAPKPEMAVLQDDRWGVFTYTFTKLTPGADADVNLFFNETYWTAAGKRQFNVAINGAAVLTNFDIYATAGAKNKAVFKTFKTKADAAGKILLSFTKGSADMPSVTAIEVISGPPTVAVAVAPTTKSVLPSGSADFTATVTNATNPAVTWKVDEVGGGSVSALGHYVAPATQGVYHVRATSVEDPTKSAAATVTVAPVTVSVAPASINLATGASTTFTATVTSTDNTAVRWTVDEPTGGSVSTTGVYTAPAIEGTFHVRATSEADPTKSAAGIAVVTKIPPPPDLFICTGGPASGKFVADVYFSGGTVDAPMTTAVDTSSLTTVVPQTVLQSQRYGPMTYTIPGYIPGMPYTVTLYFVENWWTAAGLRTFNVAINGTSVLSNFDIFATAGARGKAVEKSFKATADASGKIVIAFTNGLANNAKIDGIAITTPPNALPTISAIADRTIECNSSTGAYFTVRDVETPAANLILAASSGNPTLVPPANIFFDTMVDASGAGPNRTVAVTPAAGQSGTATITITVTDANGGSASTSFTVTVNPPDRDCILDRNEDGISDVWASLYPTAGLPTADPDGDGVSNLDEAKAGTNPLSAASRFAVTTSVDASGNLALRWLGVSGKHYFIETSADLTTWTALATEYVGTGAEIVAIVRSAASEASTRAFWHVVVFDVDTNHSGLNDWEKTHPEAVATISVTAPTNGSITPAGRQYVAKGSSLAFAITPAAGYMVDQVLVDSQSAGSVGAYTFSDISAGAHSISASFKPDGSLRVSPSSLKLAGSATLTVTSVGAWTVSSSHDWLTVTPAAGTGNGTITVTGSVNPGATARNAVITVIGSAASGIPPVATVPVTQGPVSNLALGKTATASTTEANSAAGATFTASNAVDASATTRWSSAASDPQWIMVDLGKTYQFSQVVLVWENAFGKAYEIQTSSNGTTWTPIYSTATGDGGTDTIDVTATARYVRMHGTARGTAWGYSLYDFRIMGDPADVGPTITTEPAAQTQREGQTATFTVAATGQGTLTYQWFRAVSGSTTFAAISGATSASYTTPVLVQGVDNGAKYRAQVTDATSLISSDSAVALLTVKGLGPDITKQPAGQTAKPGETATFTVEASGIGSLSYQWYRANPGSMTFAPVSGAIASSYTTPVLAIATDNGASYRVVLKDNSNNYTTTSDIAALEVIDLIKGDPVRYYGEMQVSGNQIIGSLSKKPFRVTGMSFYWSHWAGKFYNRGTVDRLMDDMGCEIVRAAFSVSDNGVPQGSYGDVDNVVQAAIDRGLYVVIDYHSHGANQNTQAGKDFFARMAQKWGSYNNVIFEIFNEPRDTPWTSIKPYALAVIPEIRKYSDNLIIVGSNEWSQRVDEPAADPLMDPNDRTKLAPNVAYTLHFYSGTHKLWLRTRADAARAKGLALMVTEWGSCDANGGGAIDYDETRLWFAWMKEHNISSMGWAVNDIPETSSIYSGSGYSASGTFLKEMIWDASRNAPWRP